MSLSERAAEAVRQRVDGLAEEVANLGEIVRNSNASTATALEQLLAGEQRSRCVCGWHHIEVISEEALGSLNVFPSHAVY